MRILKLTTLALGALLFLLCAGFLTLGLAPAAEDPFIDPRAAGAGASSVVDGWTGLQRDFPAVDAPATTPQSNDAVELGRLLFFDPMLSRNDDQSCATCHHPDRGLADGQMHPVGVEGRELPRHTPTLWNVAYAGPLFWDGRAETLEDQAHTPLTHPDEMANDPDALVAKLRAIPEYVEHFEAVFPEDGVTFDNVARALAAFQRTLISNDSAFDRFAAGDRDALSESQQRGLNLFRSAATRCFECHVNPTFTNNTFRTLGVPEEGVPEEVIDDLGRAEVADDAAPGAFRVPTLRNVALTAPYMHNGSLATLEEVVQFYADGGGRARGNGDVDFFVQGFSLSQQEQADLVDFLHALTDESALPNVPEEVPSGLPVVERIERENRVTVESFEIAPAGEEAELPRVLRVAVGEVIQEAVDRARPGDTVEIEYGVYHQNVVVNSNDLTLRGVPNAAGDFPVLDGQNDFADGVLASANGFTVERLHLRNYTGNGVLVEGARNVTFRDLRVEDVGVYGVYPVHSSGVLIERVEASGVKDAGIYVGQCEDIVVRDSVAYDNVIGIEVENSVDYEVSGNHVYDNSAGLFFVLLPQLTSKVSTGGNVYDNVVEHNNLSNFADADMVASLIPPGTGVLILAADDVELYDNTITDNDSGGVAVFRLTVAFDADRIDVPDRPERIWVHDNQLRDNGAAPDAFLNDLGIPGADILWDGSSWQVRFDQPNASKFPPALPSSGWPDVARRGYWRVLDFVVGRLL